MSSMAVICGPMLPPMVRRPTASSLSNCAPPGAASEIANRSTSATTGNVNRTVLRIIHLAPSRTDERPRAIAGKRVSKQPEGAL